MNAETNCEKARRILGREAARQRRLVANMSASGVPRQDWTAQQVKDLRFAMRRQHLSVLEQLQELLG
jgi:hypothetical protein